MMTPELGPNLPEIEFKWFFAPKKWESTVWEDRVLLCICVYVFFNVFGGSIMANPGILTFNFLEILDSEEPVRLS